MVQVAPENRCAERVSLSAFVDREQRDQVYELAARRDRSVSSIIRQAVKGELERERHGDTAA